MHDRSETVRAELLEEHILAEQFSVRFLAAGEYNENYVIETATDRMVFRINHGTQLGLEEQMAYEYGVLEAVAPSGVTPAPIRLGRRNARFERGYLLMEFLAGQPMSYERDSMGAAECFARIHALPPSDATARLLRQETPVAAILDECEQMLLRTPDYDRTTRLAIERYRDAVVCPVADYAFGNDSLCVVNTEVNSGNFVVSPDAVRLLDWEKAVWSQRYQDLGHFVVATTTLWKSDYRFTSAERERFLRRYHEAASPEVTFDELDRHTRVMEETILLRAFSWIHMALAEYEQTNRTLQNRETYNTMRRYVSEIDSFLRIPS